MHFYQRLAGLRKDAGLSQEQLAEKAGVSRQTIFKWEAGLRQPCLRYSLCRLSVPGPVVVWRPRVGASRSRGRGYRRPCGGRSCCRNFCGRRSRSRLRGDRRRGDRHLFAGRGGNRFEDCGDVGYGVCAGSAGRFGRGAGRELCRARLRPSRADQCSQRDVSFRAAMDTRIAGDGGIIALSG